MLPEWVYRATGRLGGIPEPWINRMFGAVSTAVPQAPLRGGNQDLFGRAIPFQPLEPLRGGPGVTALDKLSRQPVVELAEQFLLNSPITPLDVAAGLKMAGAMVPLSRGVAGAKAAKSSEEYAKTVAAGVTRWLDEVRGQGLLDDIIESGGNPQEIARQFWGQTYFKLPREVQDRFNLLFKRHAGIPVERAIGEAGSPFQYLDLGNRADYLEGTDRGFVVLMNEANKRFGGAR